MTGVLIRESRDIQEENAMWTQGEDRHVKTDRGRKWSYPATDQGTQASGNRKK